MATVLDIEQLNNLEPAPLNLALTTLAKSGVVFRSPAGDLIVTSPQGTVPLYAAHVQPSELMGALWDHDLLRFATRAGNSVPLAAQRTYEKKLGQALSAPRSQAALPLAEGAYNLPAVVIENGGLIEAWAGLHNGRLFTGCMLPIGTATPGYPLLHKWLSAMVFQYDTHKANLFGYILAALARPICSAFPFLLLDGTDRVVGKSTVAAAISYFLTGENASPILHSGGEAEVEKRLACFLGRPGPNVVWFDNVVPKKGQQKTIGGQLLAAAATTPCVQLRPLYGKRLEMLDYPVLVFTMNSAAVSPDLADRNVRVILTSPARYFEPHPLTFVKENRAGLLREALNILLSIRVDGGFENRSRFGVWETIAVRAAAKLGLIANYDRDAVDTSDALVKELYATISDVTEDNRKQHATFTELAGRVQMNAHSLPELAAAVMTARTSSPRGQALVLQSIVTGLAQRLLYVDGRSVRFVVSKNSSNQYVVTMESSP